MLLGRRAVSLCFVIIMPREPKGSKQICHRMRDQTYGHLRTEHAVNPVNSRGKPRQPSAEALFCCSHLHSSSRWGLKIYSFATTERHSIRITADTRLVPIRQSPALFFPHMRTRSLDSWGATTSQSGEGPPALSSWEPSPQAWRCRFSSQHKFTAWWKKKERHHLQRKWSTKAETVQH